MVLATPQFVVIGNAASITAPLNLLMVAGGVALILFGVRFLRRGLDRLFGPRLRNWIQRLARNRIRAFFSGIGLALMAPSSTTMSVISVQTIQAGHASARQMLALRIGADIGMTITVVLLAFRLETYAPILMLLGVPLYQMTRRTQTRGLGQVILAIGFIFLGVLTIRSTMASADADPHLIELVNAAGHYPIVLAAVAAALAVLLQSGTATIAVMIGLVASDTITMPVPVMLTYVAGANIGVAVTTLLIAANHFESKRLALGDLIAKMTVGVMVLLFVRPISDLVAATALDPTQQVALMHTGFNVVLAVVCLPLVGPIYAISEKIVGVPDQDDRFRPRYVTDGPIDSVALALGQSRREVLRVGEIVREMLGSLWKALEDNDESLAVVVSNRDDEVDLLDAHVKRFLTRLNAEGLDGDDAAEQMCQLRYLSELETIGDIIDKNLSELVSKKIRNRVEFSEPGREELNRFFQNIAENMEIAETAFSTRDQILAFKLLRHKDRIDQTERELRDRHFERLNAGFAASHETSAIHLDLLTHLKRINSCVTHIAYSIVRYADHSHAPS